MSSQSHADVSRVRATWRQRLMGTDYVRIICGAQSFSRIFMTDCLTHGNIGSEMKVTGNELQLVINLFVC